MKKENIEDTINILMGHYFKRKRYECGLTGKEMGELLCVSQQHISRYERGETAIPLSSMVFFLDSHAFSLSDFFNYLLAGMKGNYSPETLDNYQYIKTQTALYT
ncbi:helix-turn-helix domain-containing protein [Providencia vermicola]|uniref:helix-turn-helix domain-containing protein n=1 Tax=Providencia vermicola TaxID=333965 RepID=UPI003D2D082B